MSSSRRSDGKRVVESLLRSVRCYICSKELSDPRMLECFHMFCKTCLDGYIEFTCPDGHINCPLCSVSTVTPHDGAKGLKKNIYLNLNTKAVAVKCDVCDEENTAVGTCIECGQDFCQNCLRYHGSIAATREHHVVFFDKNHPSGRVRCNLYCKIHTDEKLDYFCLQCEELVCQHCNMTTHKQHNSRYVMDLSDLFREDLIRVVKSDEYLNYALWMTDRREELTKEKKKITKMEQDAVKAINEHAKIMHDLVDKIKSMRIRESSEKTNAKMQPIKNGITNLDREILSYISVFLVAKHTSERADDTEIANSGQKLITKLEKLKCDNPLPNVTRDVGVRFTSHDVSRVKLEPYFGSVMLLPSIGNPELLYDFVSNQGGSTISGILPTEDGRAWIVDGMDGLVQLYDMSGRIHKTFHLGVQADDLISGLNGKMYVSCNSAKEVKVIDSKLKVSKLISTENCARGLAYDTNSGSIVMCVTEKNAFFDHETHHNNKVVRIIVNMNKKRMETPDVISYAGFPVVEYPARLAVTKAGYIAVSDWKRNCVTVLDGNGHVQTEYFGLRKGDAKEVFCPRGICSSGNGQILVADYNNNRIMLLDETGQTFQAILSAQNDIVSPWSLAFGQDSLLWVGSKNGQVRVYNLHLDKKLEDTV